MKETEVIVHQGIEATHSRFVEGQECLCDAFFSVMARRMGITKIVVKTTVTEVYEEAQLQRLRRCFGMSREPDNE